MTANQRFQRRSTGETVRLSAIAICLLALSGCAVAPRFSDHPAVSTYEGKPAPVDFSSSPEMKSFRTVLKAGAAKGPNFAGVLTVVTWGCGTNCMVVAILSAESGTILSSLQTCGGLDYRLDSTLLISNPEPGDDYPAGCETTFYRWAGDRLQRLGS